MLTALVLWVATLRRIVKTATDLRTYFFGQPALDMPDFPFVINGVAELDTAILIFSFMDTKTLARCRGVSQRWRNTIDSSTPLWSRMSLTRAVWRNREDICQLIVEHAKDKNPAGVNGWTPLHAAASNNISTDIFRLIIDSADDKNPRNKWGDTPLHSAARNGRMDIVRLVLDRVEDKNPTDERGRTPLHLAALSGHTEIFRLIFEGVQVKNPADDWGNTPLHHAAGSHRRDICRIILQVVENKHPRTEHGATPLDYAGRHPDIVSLFNEFV